MTDWVSPGSTAASWAISAETASTSSSLMWARTCAARSLPRRTRTIAALRAPCPVMTAHQGRSTSQPRSSEATSSGCRSTRATSSSRIPSHRLDDGRQRQRRGRVGRAGRGLQRRAGHLLLARAARRRTSWRPRAPGPARACAQPGEADQQEHAAAEGTVADPRIARRRAASAARGLLERRGVGVLGRGVERDAGRLDGVAALRVDADRRRDERVDLGWRRPPPGSWCRSTTAACSDSTDPGAVSDCSTTLSIAVLADGGGVVVAARRRRRRRSRAGRRVRRRRSRRRAARAGVGLVLHRLRRGRERSSSGRRSSSR